MSRLEENTDIDIKNLLNELINLVEIQEFEAQSLTNIFVNNLKKRKQEFSLDDSILELDEYFRSIDDLDNVKSTQDELFYTNIKCDACKSKTSLFWRRVAREKIVCNSCFYEKAYLILFDDEHMNKKIKVSQQDSHIKSSNTNQTNNNKKKSSTTNSKTNNLKSKQKLNFDSSNRPLTRTSVSLKTQVSTSSNSTINSIDESNVRKSSRIESKSKISKDGNNENITTTNTTETTTTNNNNCNRRTKFFKKQAPIPVKREVLVSKINNSDYVFHRGFYMQVGDIVALKDKEDNDNIYFAQIRAFLSNQFAEKSAVITWLVPVNDNHKNIKTLKDFDPKFFELGPAEEFPRSLDCMEFVCRLENNPIYKSNLNYFNTENQYKTELLKHRYELEDLAQSNFKLVTKFYHDTAYLKDYEVIN